MEIAIISDIHGNLICYPSDYWKNLWECEALFICGDIFPLHIQFDVPKCRGWLIKEFIPWASELPVEKVYVIGGNHDAYFERQEKEARTLLPEQGKITYIKNWNTFFSPIRYFKILMSHMIVRIICRHHVKLF